MSDPFVVIMNNYLSLNQMWMSYTKLIFLFSVILICIVVVVITSHSGDGLE